MGHKQMVTEFRHGKITSASHTSVGQKHIDSLVMKKRMQTAFMNSQQQFMLSRDPNAVTEEGTQLGHITGPRQKQFNRAPLHRHPKLSENWADMACHAFIGLGIAQAS